ncbi:MAG: amino acid ABC transporter permease [Campylobacteraceae bacterium]|jgi:polar amino acid transport system permease protein|nr:amino acid ABC transporter permease [Campylobacteraceae bacterium]
MQPLGIDILFEGINMQRLLGGLWVTVRIALISILISVFLGIIVGVLATSKNIFIRFVYKFYLESVRVIPIIVWLFVFYYGFAKAFSVQWSGELTGIIVFSIWGTAEMSDLVRAAGSSLPFHQKQSAMALGLSGYQIYLYVIVPQAMRRLIPAAINLATRIIKTTPLVAMITVVEVLKIGQQLIEQSVLTNPKAAFWVYGFIFVLYFVICYPVSLASKKLENRWKA